MPDLQSELSKLANAWDSHEETIRTPNQTQPNQENNMTVLANTAPTTPKSKRGGSFIRNNVMRTCFELVKLSPGKRRYELVDILRGQGFKESSTAAVYSQLLKTGQVTKDENNRLFLSPGVKEYQPINPNQLRKKPRVKKSPSAGIAALKGGTAAVTVNTEDKRGLSTIIVSRNWTPESVIDKLTLPQAKALYAALHVYFGK